MGWKDALVISTGLLLFVSPTGMATDHHLCEVTVVAQACEFFCDALANYFLSAEANPGNPAHGSAECQSGLAECAAVGYCETLSTDPLFDGWGTCRLKAGTRAYCNGQHQGP